MDGACNKNDVRVEAYGAIDELNSLIGLCRSVADSNPFLVLALQRVQSDLFTIGSELATIKPENAPVKATEGMYQRLEAEITELNSKLPPLKNFILPGGGELSARLHVARAVCRRAERRVLALNEEKPVSHACRVYLNRLSDWLFVASRYSNHLEGSSELVWSQKKG